MELNTPYVLMQMGCESIRMWKENVSESLQAISLAGGIVYGALRMGGPLLTRVPEVLGFDFPELRNHFFVLRKSSEPGMDSPVRH
ncbi:MAG: hypothetical protein VCC00_00115 [Deltaproteobacteria bacterium]